VDDSTTNHTYRFLTRRLSGQTSQVTAGTPHPTCHTSRIRPEPALRLRRAGTLARSSGRVRDAPTSPHEMASQTDATSRRSAVGWRGAAPWPHCLGLQPGAQTSPSSTSLMHGPHEARHCRCPAAPCGVVVVPFSGSVWEPSGDPTPPGVRGSSRGCARPWGTGWVVRG
jgi:hypothetical protein